MKTMRFAARATAGAVASTVLLVGALAAPAAAGSDNARGGSAKNDTTVSTMKDTGWP